MRANSFSISLPAEFALPPTCIIDVVPSVIYSQTRRDHARNNNIKGRLYLVFHVLRVVLAVDVARWRLALDSQRSITDLGRESVFKI